MHDRPPRSTRATWRYGLSLALLAASLPASAAPRKRPSPDAEPPPEAPTAPAADAPAADPTAITVPPEILRRVEADYPKEAFDAGIEGTVGLQITLDAKGAVTAVEVITPAGHGFDEAAVAAVQAMTFAPAETVTGPIGVVFTFDYAFKLSEQRTDADLSAVVNLEGTVFTIGTRSPVAGADVVLEPGSQSTTTDEKGHFSFRGLPPATYKVRILDAAHEVLDDKVEIDEGKLTEATFRLRPLDGGETEVVVTYIRPKTEVTQRELSIEEIKRIPGSFGDPVKVIQTLPGAARSPFGTGLLIIRGANPEDSAVYVDGIRIPIVYHLTGTTSVLSPDVVNSVQYMPGGYGVQYGRSTAGTINVETKDRFKDRRLVWGTDILDTQLWFEGNLGKNKQHGFAIGARRSYIDAFIPLFTRNTGFTIRPVYWDYQAKWVPKLGDNDRFSIFVYGFQDIIRVAPPADRAVSTEVNAQGGLSTTYQSHRIVARWRHKFSETLSFDLQPSWGVDLISLGLGSEFGLDNNNNIVQLRAELQYKPHPSVEFLPGVDFIGGPWRFDFRSGVSFADLDDPLAERDPVGFDGKGWAWSPDAYLKTNLRPLADRDQWLITAGVRASTAIYTYGGGITFGEDVKPTVISGIDGRFSTRLRTFEKGKMSGTLKASTGWYTQPPQPFESLGLGTSAELSAERAWNSSLGFEHRINDAINWDLDIFYRRMDRLAEFNDSFTGQGSQPFSSTGRGYAAGFEILIRHAPVKRFFGWISYTFSRSFRQDGSADSDRKWYPFDFDQPHIFSAQGGYNLPKGWGLSAQIQAVSGNPTSNYNAGIYDADGDFYNGFRIGDGNSERLPPFVQTSLRVDKTWTFRKWQLLTYLDLINVVRGVNPEATVYNYDYSEYAYVRGLPFIPNFGFEAKFWQ